MAILELTSSVTTPYFFFLSLFRYVISYPREIICLHFPILCYISNNGLRSRIVSSLGRTVCGTVSYFITNDLIFFFFFLFKLPILTVSIIFPVYYVLFFCPHSLIVVKEIASKTDIPFWKIFK